MPNVTFLEPGTDGTQDLSFWSSTTGAVSSSTSNPVTGPRSLQCSTGSPAVAAIAIRSGVLADAGRRISMNVRLNGGMPATNAGLIRLFDASNLTVFDIAVRSTGVIVLTPVGVAAVDSTITLSVDTTHRIAISYTVTSTSVWRVAIFVDGVLAIAMDSTGTMTRVGTDELRVLQAAGWGTNRFAWFDNIYIDDGSDYTDPGSIRVTAKRPNANGTTNGFTTQIGAGGSGYGSGHSPQVNEQPLSQTNGWSMVGAGAAVTEEYTVEGIATGAVDITPFAINAVRGWVLAKSLISETGQIIVNGTQSAVALTSTATVFFANSATPTVFPSGASAIGLVTDTSLTTVSLYECGILVAYRSRVPRVQHQYRSRRVD